MLAGQMSNQDEDEVEDELDALEAEVTGVKTKLPDAPTQALPEGAQKATEETPRERARRRTRDQESSQPAEPMLA